MKDLIVTIAVIVFLLTFPLQYAVEQNNHSKISQFQAIVHNSSERARAQGYFTVDIINDLKQQILQSFPTINESDLIIDVTTSPKYRCNEFDERELISYKIGVPIKKILATPKFWGISEEDNKMMYIIDRQVTSERILN